MYKIQCLWFLWVTPDWLSSLRYCHFSLQHTPIYLSYLWDPASHLRQPAFDSPSNAFPSLVYLTNSRSIFKLLLRISPWSSLKHCPWWPCRILCSLSTSSRLSTHFHHRMHHYVILLICLSLLLLKSKLAPSCLFSFIFAPPESNIVLGTQCISVLIKLNIY